MTNIEDNEFVENTIFVDMCDEILVAAYPNRNFEFNMLYDPIADLLPINTSDQKGIKDLLFLKGILFADFWRNRNIFIKYQMGCFD